jgi:hypothetical protein
VLLERIWMSMISKAGVSLINALVSADGAVAPL